jgi:hypothetical protein
MKHLFQLSLLLLAILLPATALAHDFEVDGIYYNINGNEATVTYLGSYGYQYEEYTGDVSIPATVTYNGTTYSVTSIGDYAFQGCIGLTSIIIPNSVAAIGNNAFYGCIGLTSIDIPNSVTHIGVEAFSGCSCLTSITVASGNSKYDSRNNCNAIIETASNTLIGGCQNTVIPNSVITIGQGAFYNCIGLTSITIPNSVTSIGDVAFFGCTSLTSIIIPNSVTNIGQSSFYGTAWYENQPDGMVYAGLVAYNYKGIMPNEMSIIIRDGTRGIAGSAFWGRTELTNIDIPNSVISIGDNAFYGCIGLTSINIPNSVISIGGGTFCYCSGLTSITIGNSVTSIGSWTFMYCALTEIYSLAFTPPKIDFGTFIECYGATLFVPKEALNAYKTADYWKDFTNIVGIGSVLPGNTFIVDGIYYRVTDVNEVSVIANEEIEAYYTGDVIIPDSIIYEDYSYAVTGIEDNAFDGCFELTSITIPNSVEAIGEQAFQGCTGLKSVTIGSGVKTIGAKAFNYCNALETVKCLGTVPPVMASTDCFSTAAYNRATLLVPRNSEATYSATDYWYKFANIDGWGSAGQGDVNGDGVMNITDVTALIDVLLGHELDSFYFESADLNINGRLDIGNVTSLIDNLLNGDY